jgi:hypothetical protein
LTFPELYDIVASMENHLFEEHEGAGRKQSQREWYERNRAQVLERSKNWRLANKSRHDYLKKEWAKRNPDKVAKSLSEARWRRAGIKGATQELYDALHTEQGGVCAICKEPSPTRKLGWDHSHFTGQPRGLLCGKCNFALGWYERLLSRPAWMEKALNYLEKQETPDN